MSGTLVSVSGQNVTLSHGGKSANTAHAVDPGASITLNGKAATLADLQAGDTISGSGDPATSVSATRSA